MRISIRISMNIENAPPLNRDYIRDPHIKVLRWSQGLHFCVVTIVVVAIVSK